MPETTITPEHIAAAETLAGLSFSADQRELLLKTLSERIAHYQAIRAAPLENSMPMALNFSADFRASSAAVPRTFAVSAPPAAVRPDRLEDIAFWPLTQLAELIRTRQVTALELTELYLDRLKRYNPALNCVACLTEDLAYQQARRADDEIARGLYRGPLHGMPWGAKDLLATKGYPTGWGAAPYQDQLIDLDAAVVGRLEEAGAVLIAKLTLGELANGDVWHGGMTRNPWDTEEGSSGSSAGSGAAVAAGLVAFAIGTETMGSIVSPSNRCGVTGLRPTFGRVSRHGAMALSWSMDKIGPMCRAVEDCALVFSAIYGPDGHDATVTPHPFTWDPSLDPHSLRIGYVAGAFEADETDPSGEDESKGAYAQDSLINSARTLDVMRGLGFQLMPIELPPTDTSALYLILIAEAAAAFDAITRDDRVSTLAGQGEHNWPNIFRAARFIPAVEYINANRIRSQLMRDMATVMRDIDVFLVPSFRGNAMQITNFTGHPTVVVPNGFSARNTPTSISFIGGLYAEAETLSVAKAYQDATDWHLRHPQLTKED